MNTHVTAESQNSPTDDGVIDSIRFLLPNIN